jgi:Protein of unknown function (DUF1769)
MQDSAIHAQQLSQSSTTNQNNDDIDVKVKIIEHPKLHNRSTSMDSNTSVCSSSLAVGTFPVTMQQSMDNNNNNHQNDDIVYGNETNYDSNIDVASYNEESMVSVSTHGGTMVEGHEGQHPALSALCVMDCRSERRIVPNANEPFVLDNECFTGTVMLLVRTPDADQHHIHLPSIRNHHRNDIEENIFLGPTQQRVSQYFRGKKRRFEFQFQIRLKKVPMGALFLGCELERSVKVGGLTKTLVNLLLGMVRRINPGFHYSWGTGPDHTSSNSNNMSVLQSGDYEKTHLSFPVEASMDRIVITHPGETPPTLGQELEESAESVKRRRKMGAGSVDWNTEDTFTMCLWSAYADWIKWKSFNVPGVSPFSLCRVTGKQPIYLSVYEITSCTSADYKKKRPPHLQKDLKIYTRLEFSNEEKTTGGIAERKCIGRRSNVVPSDQSVPDTDSVCSDFETMSRISHITN